MTEPQCQSHGGAQRIYTVLRYYFWDLNGDDYAAIPLKESEIMHIGYIKHKGTKLSKLGEIYIDALKNYENKVL